MTAQSAAKLAVDSRPGGAGFLAPQRGASIDTFSRVLRKSEKGNAANPHGCQGVSSNLARPIEQPC